MDTTLATVGQIVVRLLEMHGVDASALLREQGIDPSMTRDPGVRVSTVHWEAVMRRAASLIPDPTFGLRAARCWHPSNFGALGHGWLSAETLLAGLGLLVRYWGIVGVGWVPSLAEKRDEVSFVLNDPQMDPVVAPIATDITLSIVLDMCRMNYGASLRPVRIDLLRPRPLHAEVYPAFYGCPVVFAAGRRAIVLSRADAEKPLPTSNRQLALVHDKVIAEELARLDRSDVLAQCKASLLEMLPSGELSKEMMAKRLRMSQRTLNRKLTERDTTYQKLVDDTRRDLALLFIDDPRRSIGDITFELGFSQQSALTRAFRRWTGKSPTDWRQERQANPLRPLGRSRSR